MVQVTYEMDLTNFGDLDMLWGQARDFVKDRSLDEMKQINNYFNECYNDNDLSLTGLNDILAYESDYLLEEVLGYKKDQNDNLTDPQFLTDINDETISYNDFIVVMTESSEVLDYISEETKSYILNFKFDEEKTEKLDFFTNWINVIKEKTDPESEIYSELDDLSAIEFDNNYWTFD